MLTLLPVGVYSNSEREDCDPDLAETFLPEALEFDDVARDTWEKELSDEVGEDGRNNSFCSVLVLPSAATPESLGNSSPADAPPDSLANFSLAFPALALSVLGEPRRGDKLALSDEKP
jgi:hypothetical protein